MAKSVAVVGVAGLVAVVGVGGMCGRAAGQPLGTGFVYQGELRADGVAAVGVHDLRFRLYDAPTGTGQVGGVVCVNDVVLEGGRFSVALDFGAVFAGQMRYLEVEVRPDAGLGCGDGTGFVVLAARQALSSTPNANYSITAGTATFASDAGALNGQGASFYQNAANLSSGTLPSGRLSGAYTGAVSLTNGANSFVGSGAGLSALNASSVATGTLGDARLSSNVALLGSAQSFTGAKTFAVAPTFGAAGVPFNVASAALVANLNADLLDGLSASAFLQAVPNPLVLNGSNTVSVIRGENSNVTALSAGVFGRHNATAGVGVFGEGAAATGTNYGGYFRSTSSSGRGVLGEATAASGSTYGVYGRSESPAGVGVYAEATSLTGTTYGVAGQSFSASGVGAYGLSPATGTSGTGVLGVAEATTGSNYGGRFLNSSTSGTGVLGLALAFTGGTVAVKGQSLSTSGTGVEGLVTAGSGSTVGVSGESASTAGRGVDGLATAVTGTNYGVAGQSNSSSGRGVFGLANASTGSAYGGEFRSVSTTGRGVLGEATAASGTAYGGEFRSASTSGRAVFGEATAASGFTDGGYFTTASTTGTGVYGHAMASTGSGYGVWGETQAPIGRAVFGWAQSTSGDNVGVEGRTSSGTGWGVFSTGRFGATGTKSFRIDHPADPENKYLLHYSAESPEVINFYRGMVTLDESGSAVVELPEYFARINLSPSYVLTAVGAPMPMLHVSEKISEADLLKGQDAGPGEAVPVCRFVISGGASGGEVSWRVEAVRNDRWVRAARPGVEVEKTGEARGTYQHPELYGKPAGRGEGRRRGGE